MRTRFKEFEHLLRVAGVLAAGLVIFLLVRQVLVPADFGRYGHYRPGTLDDNRKRPLHFAGQESCAACHDTEVTLRSQGKHAGVSCEACHGPLFEHTENPVDIKPKLPEVKILCRRCHEADAAKPKTFPQVATEEHSGGALCNTCHQPHKPNF